MSGFMDMSKFLNDDYRISLADTYKGGISLTETMNRSIGKEISARLRSKVIEHMNRKVADWDRRGAKEFQGSTDAGLKTAAIGSGIGAGISFATPYLANKWWGSKPPTDLGTGLADNYLMKKVHPEVYTGINSLHLA